MVPVGWQLASSLFGLRHTEDHPENQLFEHARVLLAYLIESSDAAAELIAPAQAMVKQHVDRLKIPSKQGRTRFKDTFCSRHPMPCFDTC